MYLKLTTRCALRSLKQYSVFMFTITMVMTLFYAFNSLLFSQQILTMMGEYDTMLSAFLLVSILLVMVMTWLIGYIERFIIKSRSRELGMYLLSGMERKTVAMMLVLEMMFMGFLSFIIGCILGSFLSEIFHMMIVQFFSQNYNFTIHFSINTLLLTFLYFLFMWGVTLWRERKSIMKISIRELLYEESKNDRMMHHRFLKWVTLCIAIITLGFGFYFMKKGILNTLYGDSSNGLFKGIILLVISNYAFYYGMIDWLDAFVMKQKQMKYQFGVLPLYGHIKSRIHGNRMVLATLSMLLIFTILLSSFALKLHDASKEQMDIICPYELQIETPDPFATDHIKSLLKNKGYQVQDEKFGFYQITEAKSNVKETIYAQEKDLSKPIFMKESDYQKLLKMKNMTVENLPSHGFIVLVNEFNEPKAKDLTLSIKDEKMKLTQIRSDNIGQQYDDVVLVVEDKYLLENMMVSFSYIANTDKPLEIGIEDEIIDHVKLPIYAIVNARSDTQHASISSSVTIIFALFYLSFVFICTAATIMATQQMMDATKQKYEYELMYQLGMDKTEIYATLRKQIGIYFFVPMLLPVLYILPLLYIINMLFLKIPGSYSLYTVAFGCIILYMVIYFCYYLMAYIGCKRSLNLK